MDVTPVIQRLILSSVYKWEGFSPLNCSAISLEEEFDELILSKSNLTCSMGLVYSPRQSWLRFASLWLRASCLRGNTRRLCLPPSSAFAAP